MSDKKKFPWAGAMEVARALAKELEPFIERIALAGSLRRCKPEVSDVELLYIPKLIEIEKDLLGGPGKYMDMAEARLRTLLENGCIGKRVNEKGSETWGPQNKLAIHLPTGIPVGFFATTADCWFNYLVCRIGPAESNIRVASAARAKGWKWNPYGPGFTDEHAQIIQAKSQEDVFSLVGLPYQEPNFRK